MPFPSSSYVQGGTFTGVQELGQGAGTVVYQAYYAPRNRPVAVKTVAPGRPDAAQIQLKLAREFQVAKPLRHPQIVAVYALIQDKAQGESYLICELAPEGSLSERLAREGRLREAEAVGYALDICAALEELEQRKIVHRDLKPSNILLVQDGQGQLSAKLADFGAAQDQISQTRTAMKGDKHPGTPQYMAPEQNDVTNPVDIRADIFALGVTLWEMLAGAPFKQVGKGRRPPLRRLNPQTSAGVAAVIARATVSDLAQRYRTPRELADDLRAVRARRMPAAMRRSIGRRVGGGLAAAALVATVGVGGLFLSSAVAQGEASLAATQTRVAEAQAATATSVAGQVAEVEGERTALALTSTAIAADTTATAVAAWATGTAQAATALAHEAKTASAVAARETASAVAAEETAIARERARQEAEAQRQAEEERARQEAEAQRQAEEERARQEAEAQRRAEEERARQEAEQRARQEAEERARSHRLITISGDAYIEDDETFGSNEKGRFPIAYSFVVSPDQPTYAPGPFTHCVGDEVRVEIYFTAQLQSDRRSVQVSVRSLLFEGTSCSTNDLEKEKSLSYIVGEGITIHYNLPVSTSAGDFSVTNLDVVNRQQ